MVETITADPVSLVFDALTKLATEVINEHPGGQRVVVERAQPVG